jgi:transcriptional regulator with XRE-family HTH domain
MPNPKKSKSVSPPNEVQAHLSVRIAELRSGRKLTQLELAKSTGVALQYITKIEQGDRAPSLKTIASLAAALEVPVAELFNFEDRKIISPRVEGQVLRLRTLLEGASEEDVKLLNKLAERLVAGAVGPGSKKRSKVMTRRKR